MEYLIFVCVVLGLIFAGIIVACIVFEILGATKDSQYSFSCPNCGEKFNLDWKQIFPLRFIPCPPNFRRARCPICKKIDLLKIYRDWL